MNIVLVFSNLALLSVGIATAATAILGFAVFSSNKKSITNRSFLCLSLVAIFWGIANYTAYEISPIRAGLWPFRIVIFFATWYAFFIFRLLYVFPLSKVDFPKFYKFFVVPITILTSIITLTPLVFKDITEVSSAGKIEKIQNGPGIILFAIVIFALVISATFLLLRKTIKGKNEEKSQFKYVLLGISITSILLIVFNFILPAFFSNPRYIPLGSIFIFPFIALTFYAILKHKLLNIKILTTELLILVLAIATFSEIIFAETVSVVIFRSGVFLLVLSFGILLIRSIRREIEQREGLERLTKQLEKANKKLIKLDKLKNEFLSFASHDLKSPINVMKQFATLIHDGTYTEKDKIKNTALKIKNTATRAITMVDNFLNIRKIEEGKMEYNFEKKNIIEFVEGIASDFTLIAKQKGIETSFTSEAKKILTPIDTDKMRQVIQNLLDNSLKYTKSGSVKTSIVEEQNSVLISIQDSGIGMDKEILNSLFEQFSRDPNVAKKIRGTGLGLYISKQIILAHHGEIWAESEGSGTGSSFFIRLKKV